MKLALIFLLASVGGVGPSDVPAVHIPIDSWVTLQTDSDPTSNISSGMAVFACSNHGKVPEIITTQTATTSSVTTTMRFPGMGEKCVGGWRWGCADKSRILLTAEDGTKHCIKF